MYIDSMNTKQVNSQPLELRMRYRTRLKSAGIPPKYENCNLNNFSPGLKIYTGTSLFVHGISGIGKTRFLISLLKRQISLDIQKVIPPDIAFCRFISFQNLLSGFKTNKYSWNKDHEEKIKNLYLNSCWLYIDDFNIIENDSETQNIIYQIINHRWDNNLPLIISSRYDIAYIEKEVGENISRRIAKMGYVLELL